MHLAARRLVPLVLVAAALVGCGRTAGPLARPVSGAGKAPAGVVANAVAPDDPKVLAEDDRRAQYWSGDAVRVMAIHSTALNTTAISAAANVYLSAARFHDSKPCVFVARHYGFKAVAQFSELPDYNRLAFNLKPLPNQLEVGGKLAFDLAKAYQAPQPQPATGSRSEREPGGAPATTRAEANVFLASRAILVQGGADPEWRFYAGGQKFAINARTREVVPPSPQLNPADPLNEGGEVDLQRAAAVFLPTSLTQPNIRKEPTATN